MSPGDVTANARNTYSSAYTSVDSIVKSYIDTFYRGQGSAITEFTISSVPFDQNYFAPKRRELQQSLDLWKSHLSRGAWEPLVRDLLESHYDPAYRRSLLRNYRDAQTAAPVEVRDITRAAFLAIARSLLRAPG